jgi:hypothetical protein
MPDVDLSELLATPSYKPSGKCSPRLVPLTVLSLLLAVGLGWVLRSCEGNYYAPILTVGIVGVPLFIAIWLTLSLGRCRNVRVAVAISLLVTVVYYLGYWQMSYYLNVLRQGPEAIKKVELVSGAKGMPGYFLFRTKVKDPIEFLAPTSGTAAPSAHGDKLLNGAAFVIEFALLLYIALLIGLGNSRRVYYEHLNRWAESWGFQLQPGDTQTVLHIVQTQMWGDLEKLDHTETDFTARLKVSALLFKVELLSDVPEAPIYISLRANRLGPSGKKVVEAFGGKGDFFFKQLPLSIDSSRRFRHYFNKELKAAFFLGEENE